VPPSGANVKNYFIFLSLMRRKSSLGFVPGKPFQLSIIFGD
jgi:hypothetical protein